VQGDRPTWQRFYGDVPPHIAYPQGTVSAVIRNTIRRIPDAVAYEFLGTTTTYGELGRLLEQVAQGLAWLSLSPGDRILIALPTCPQAILAFYGAGYLGAVPVLIHPLSTAREVEDFAKRTRSRMAIVLDAGFDRFAPALEAGALECLIVTSIGDVLPAVKQLGYWLSKGRKTPRIAVGKRVHGWKELLVSADASPARLNIDTYALSTILFSGGTTGDPKGIMLSHQNLISEGLQIARWANLQEGDRILAALPLFHGFGLSSLVNAPLMAGCRVILVPQFSVGAIARVIRRCRPNVMAGVPSMYEALSRHRALRGADLSCIKVAFSGGDSLAASTKRRFDQLLAAGGSHGRLLEGYGLTEAVTAVMAMPLHLEREGSLGLPFPDTLVAIFDPGTDHELPVGDSGEICIASPAVMLGYLNDPVATSVALMRHADGKTWLHTGDIGRRDADGFFYFQGRLKRMIKSSGFNVFPNQVEQVLCEHPAVQDACVIGVPDELQGERVRAYVVPKAPAAGSTQLADELIAHCRRHLIKWSCPREIEFRPTFPKTRIGKVDQRALVGAAPELAGAAK